MKLSGSKAALARHCLYSFRDDVPASYDERSEESKLGSAAHSVAAGMINDGVYDLPNALVDAGLDASWLPALHALDMVAHATELTRQHLTARAEVAMAYDPLAGTARELGVDIGREYREHGAQPTDLCLSVDVLWLDIANSSALIVDWKTGRAEHVQPAACNDQLALAALAVARIYDLESVTVRLTFIGEDGHATHDEHTYAAFELLEVAAFVRDACGRIEGSKPCPELHCSEMFCHALAHCPATTEAIAELVPEGQSYPLVVATPADITCPAHARWMHHRIAAVKKACDVATTMLHAYVDEAGGEVDLGDGKRMVRTVYHRKGYVVPEGDVTSYKVLGESRGRRAKKEEMV